MDSWELYELPCSINLRFTWPIFENVQTWNAGSIPNEQCSYTAFLGLSMFSCRWTMFSPAESNQVTTDSKNQTTMFHGVNNGLIDVICALCSGKSFLLLLAHDPKQTKLWNGTPPQYRSSRLWWVETNAVWQWYVTPLYMIQCLPNSVWQ